MFNIIDFKNWERKEIYEKFYPCTYYITADIDLTKFLSVIKGKGLRFYPSICYCLTKVVNEHFEYRYGILDGKLGYYDSLQPLYTLLRPNNLFTHKVTNYSTDFYNFYNQFIIDANLAEQCDRLYYDDPLPKNLFCLSIAPNLKFTSMSFVDGGGEKENFIPFATVGKYSLQGDKVVAPLAVEFHHEVNDGYHAAKFYEYLQEILDNFKL